MLINPYRYATVASSDLDSYSGLVLWTQSGVGVTLDGSDLDIWADQNGNGYDLETGVSLSLPIATADQNGLDTYGPATNVNNVMYTRNNPVPEASLAPNGSSSVTLVGVIEAGASNNGLFAISNGTSAPNICDLLKLGTGWRMRARNSGGTIQNAADVAVTAGYHVLMGVVSPSRIALYIDGVLASELTTGFTFGPLTGSDRAVTVLGAGPAYLISTTAKVGEFAVYNEDRSSDAAGINSILAARWGL